MVHTLIMFKNCLLFPLPHFAAQLQKFSFNLKKIIKIISVLARTVFISSLWPKIPIILAKTSDLTVIKTNLTCKCL